MFVRRHPDDDFAGACPTHGVCLEGLASGIAIAGRWGSSLSKLGAEHRAHEIVADYLAQACVNIVSTLAPDKIILGGGVTGTLVLSLTCKSNPNGWPTATSPASPPNLSR
ncbi:MAG: hypothetical protein NVS3B5_03830 [Sphingomicrobium sp.]